MSASITAHAITDVPTSYSLAPLWRDIRDDLRARRRARVSAPAPERQLYLVASNGRLVADK